MTTISVPVSLTSDLLQQLQDLRKQVTSYHETLNQPTSDISNEVQDHSISEVMNHPLEPDITLGTQSQPDSDVIIQTPARFRFRSLFKRKISDSETTENDVSREFFQIPFRLHRQDFDHDKDESLNSHQDHSLDMLLDEILGSLSKPSSEETKEVENLCIQVEEQLVSGKVDVNFLKKANEKLGQFQLSYGNIAAISVTLAAVISGMKDLIDLVMMLGK